jgi:hypothetical protein
MKGINLISAVIFLAFLVVAVTIIYETTAPVIEKMQCSATLNKMKSSMIELDKVIQEVAAGGRGSKRVADFSIDSGKIYASSLSDSIYWEGECNSPVISPRTSQKIGNVVFGSYLETKAYEGVCPYCYGGSENVYVLENDHISACFKKLGSVDNMTTCNTSEILISVYQKDEADCMPLSRIEISLDGNESSTTGDCYTEIDTSGYNLPYGQVTLYMESGYIDYYVHFLLESGTDFISIRGD